MNSLVIDRLDTEVIARGHFDSPPTTPEDRQRESAEASDNAAVALEMVSEAAAAIKHLEQQSAEAVARARDLANSIVKKLESTEASFCWSSVKSQSTCMLVARETMATRSAGCIFS